MDCNSLVATIEIGRKAQHEISDLNRLKHFRLLEVLGYPRTGLLSERNDMNGQRQGRLQDNSRRLTSVDSPCSSSSLETSNFGAFKILALRM
jgi:hypothetical protein